MASESVTLKISGIPSGRQSVQIWHGGSTWGRSRSTDDHGVVTVEYDGSRSRATVKVNDRYTGLFTAQDAQEARRRGRPLLVTCS